MFNRRKTAVKIAEIKFGDSHHASSNVHRLPRSFQESIDPILLDQSKEKGETVKAMHEICKVIT